MDNYCGWNTSYVFGQDEESGWEGRYFFTYYSEFGPKFWPLTIIELLIFSLIFVVSIIANISIVICVIKFPDMRTVTNVFVLNLAAADILFTITIPVVAYTRVVTTWKLGQISCRTVPYVQFVSGIVLLWTLSLISIDRHKCIVLPPYRSKMTSKEASAYCLLIWTLVALIFIPILFWFRTVDVIPNFDPSNIKPNKSSTSYPDQICTLIFPKSSSLNYSLCFLIPVLLFACLLPMALLVYHYQRIFHKILSTKNAWATSCIPISNPSIPTATNVKATHNNNNQRRQSEISITEIFVPWPRRFSTQIQSDQHKRSGSLSQHEEMRLHKHIKVVRVLFLNVVLVLVMWLPMTIIMLLIYIDGSRPTSDTNYFLRSHHFIAVLVVAFLNTVVNPLLYGVLNDSFRACLMRIWGLKKPALTVTFKEGINSSGNKVTSTFRRQQGNLNSVSETREV